MKNVFLIFIVKIYRLMFKKDFNSSSDQICPSSVIDCITNTKQARKPLKGLLCAK